MSCAAPEAVTSSHPVGLRPGGVTAPTRIKGQADGLPIRGCRLRDSAAQDCRVIPCVEQSDLVPVESASKAVPTLRTYFIQVASTSTLANAFGRHAIRPTSQQSCLLYFARQALPRRRNHSE